MRWKPDGYCDIDTRPVKQPEAGGWTAHDLWFATRGRATSEAGVDSRMALSIAPFMMGSCEMVKWRD